MDFETFINKYSFVNSKFVKDFYNMRISVMTHYHFLYNLKDNIANIIFYNV